jgi:hypothetical protein
MHFGSARTPTSVQRKKRIGPITIKLTKIIQTWIVRIQITSRRSRLKITLRVTGWHRQLETYYSTARRFRPRAKRSARHTNRSKLFAAGGPRMLIAFVVCGCIFAES